MGWGRAHSVYRRLLRGVEHLPEVQQVRKARANIREAFVLSTTLVSTPTNDWDSTSVHHALSVAEALADVLEIQDTAETWLVANAMAQTHPKWFHSNP